MMKHSSIGQKTVIVLAVLILALVLAAVPAGPGGQSIALAYEAAADFRYPLDSGGWFLGQAFGVWNSYRNEYHLAEDLLPLNGRTELSVYAPANGQVKYSGYQSGYGYMLVIEHRLPDNTYVCSVLGHLKPAGLAPRGAEVKKGQRVGYISANPRENGGYSFAHLHFGIRSGAYSTARDPDGGWRYQGYAGAAVRALWHHPSNFVKAHATPAPSPTPDPKKAALSVSADTLNFGYLRRWYYATPRSYTVSGTGLTGSVRIEAPEGFWISLNYSSGYRKTLQLQPRNGAVNQTVYVSFLPLRAKSYSGKIVHSSPGAGNESVAVYGRGY